MLEQPRHLPITAERAIEQIAADNASGAAQILRRAGNLFSLLNTELSAQAPSGEVAQQAILAASAALVRAQPSMSPLIKLASAAIAAARLANGGRGTLKAAEEAAAGFVQEAALAARAASSRAAARIRSGARVLTHSQSSTVLRAFILARQAGTQFSVVATESRPLMEGRALAQSLAREGVPVSLIADAAAASAIQQVDFVFVGADTVTPLNLVNKIGTRMIGLAARETDLPVYALCDTSKFIRRDCSGLSGEERSAAELWPDAPQGILVINRYFESTPLAYFTGVITERGLLSSDEAARAAERAAIETALLDEIE